MTMQKPKSGPMQLIDSALRAVKGDSTQSLVEQFTAEMTTVAEGLCEDQARLRERMTDLEQAQDRDRQHLESELETLETETDETREDLRQQIKQLTARIEVLESRENKKAKKAKKWFGEGWLGQLTLLVGIACGAWVLVSILQLFH